MSEIKNCPFCNGEAVDWEEITGKTTKYYKWYVQCTKCNGMMVSVESHADAIKNWNRRQLEDE